MLTFGIFLVGNIPIVSEFIKKFDRKTVTIIIAVVIECSLWRCHINREVSASKLNNIILFIIHTASVLLVTMAGLFLQSYTDTKAAFLCSEAWKIS